jgi:hypothetical protein
VWLQSDKIIDTSNLVKLPNRRIYTKEIASEHRVLLKIGRSVRPFRCIHTTDGCEYLEVLTPEAVAKGKVARRFGDPSPSVSVQINPRSTKA